MPADDLTPSQAAELLGVDTSTLRRWARAFPDHLSEQAQAKRRTYTRADLATLYRARELLRAGKSPAEVNTILATAPAEMPEVPAAAVPHLPALAADLEEARELMRALASKVADLEAGRAADQQRIDELAAEVDRLNRRTFWQRLFGRTPPE